jgi:hypothetical protein
MQKFVHAANLLLMVVESFKYHSTSLTVAGKNDSSGTSGTSRLFVVLSVVLFVCGAAAAHLIAFGTQIATFRSYGLCVQDLFRLWNSKANFQELYNNHVLTGPVMYGIYMSFLLFLAGNVFHSLWAAFRESQESVSSTVRGDLAKMQKNMLEAMQNSVLQPMEKNLQSKRQEMRRKRLQFVKTA